MLKGKTSRVWVVDRPDNIWTETYELKESASEKDARKHYREDNGLKKLPAGTKFCPHPSTIKAKGF